MQFGRRRHQASLRTFLFTAAGPALGLFLLLALGPPAGALSLPFGALGPAAEPLERIPTFMTRGTVITGDFEADGQQDLLYVTTDGVFQRYTMDGDFLWSHDERTIYGFMGVEGQAAAQFLADYDWIRPHLRTDDGWALEDQDGDGDLELLATLSVYLDHPKAIAGTVIVTIDPTDGTILDARLSTGIVRHVQLADFDGDGGLERVFVQEDGGAYRIGERWIRGGNGTTRVWAERLDGSPLWQWDSGASWGLVSAVAEARLDGDATDIVLTLTSPLGRMTSLDAVEDAVTQELVALDGRTGSLLWRQGIDTFARAITVTDVDADHVDDLVLEIQESRNTTASRGDGRAHVEARRGADGALLWSYKGLLGDRPALFDVVAMGSTDTRIAFAYTERSSLDDYVEQTARIYLVDAPSGNLLQEVQVATDVLAASELFDVTMPDARLPMPAGVASHTHIHLMHLVARDLDADGDDDLLVGSDRGTMAFTATANGLTGRWERPERVDNNLFIAWEGPAGPEVWTQGWTIASGVSPGEGRYNTMPTYKHGRLFGYDARTGAPLPDKILMSQVHAVTRSDVDGDGTLDRVLGGVSGALFAMDGGTNRVQWVADIGAAVLSVWPEDLDGDGRSDFLVEGDLVLAAVSHDGQVLWRQQLLYVHPFHSVETRQVEAADMDGDGVRDLVYTMPSARNEGTGVNPSKVAAVNGRTGATLWVHPVFAPLSNVYGLAVGDLDGDQRPDVVYGIRYPTTAYGLGALDGATGDLLWRVEEFPSSMSHIITSDGIVLIDDDGDGDMEVVTAGANHRVRVHDGRTGGTLREFALPPTQSFQFFFLETGAIGPSGETAIVAGRYGGDDVGFQLDVVAPNGTSFYTLNLPDVTFLSDLEVGDVNGDGVDDLVGGTLQGLFAADPTQVAAGAPFIGHLSNHHASRVSLADVDGDPGLEIEFYTSDRNWPVARGTYFGTWEERVKSVGMVDLNGRPDEDPGNETPPPPVDLPPQASFGVDRTSANIGDAFTFTSTSRDDGTIVQHAWSFGDGTTATGPVVVRSFDRDGTYTVRLRVTDDAGQTDEATGSIRVAPDKGFVISQSRQGTWASPGEAVVYTVSVYNFGRTTDTYTIGLSSPAAWTATALGLPSVTLAGGEAHVWTVQVYIDSPLPQEEVVVRVRDASGDVEVLRHGIVVPMVLDAALDRDPARYGPLDEVAGTLRLTWRDGTPLIGVNVSVAATGGPSYDVVTDEDGRATFVVPSDDPYRPLGDHVVRLEPGLAPYRTYRVLPFTVTLAG